MRVGVAVVTAGIVLGVGCGGNGESRAEDAPAEGGGVFRMALLSEPSAIDPYTAQETEGLLVADLLFDGLVTLDDERPELRPGVASRWESSEDCLRWTFHLRDGSRFSNGEAVTAESFIRGMARAVDGRSASTVAYHLAGIAGYDELHGTEDAPEPTTEEFAGLSAPDPDTLVVRLSAGDCEFDKKTLHPVFSPMPEAAPIPASAEQAFTDEPIGNGPFAMDGPWQHDSSIRLVRNAGYDGAEPAASAVAFTILSPDEGIDVAYEQFRQGAFDFAYVPPARSAEARAAYEPDGAFVAPARFATGFILPSHHNAPFDNPDARKAVSHAIDREAIMRDVYQGAQQAATSLIPPPFEAEYQPGVCGACTFDVARATEHAGRAGLAPGTPVRLHYRAGPGDEELAEALAAQLADHLGLAIELRPMEQNDFYEEEASDEASGLFIDGWFADYPTADNFLFPLLSTPAISEGGNASRYSNPDFDQLLDDARATTDQAERVRLLRAAEQLAIGDDLALVPYRYDTIPAVLDAERWAGLTLNFFGNPTIETMRER